ncbi:MAG: extensin family protein [Myxococcota bacterium]|nr:extensin family protein [Myxococcota bacterium]
MVEVVHYSIYRPPSAAWPADKIASRHPGGLAIDAASFVRKDGSTLAVERDFHGAIGARTCGPGSGPTPPTPNALELRQIVCDAADAKLFNVTLTPDYNRAHRNHFHLELTADARWFMVH